MTGLFAAREARRLVVLHARAWRFQGGSRLDWLTVVFALDRASSVAVAARALGPDPLNFIGAFTFTGDPS